MVIPCLIAQIQNIICLHEEDVPGASLGGREVASLNVAELKQWLQCRRALVKGKRADLVVRYGDKRSRHNNCTFLVKHVFINDA